MHVNAPQGRSHHHTQTHKNSEETHIIHKVKCANMHKSRFINVINPSILPASLLTICPPFTSSIHLQSIIHVSLSLILSFIHSTIHPSSLYLDHLFSFPPIHSFSHNSLWILHPSPSSVHPSIHPPLPFIYFFCSFIHFLYLLNPIQEPILAAVGQDGRRALNRSPHNPARSHSLLVNLESPIYLTCMFLDVSEEAWVLRENPHILLGEHANSTQKAGIWTRNPLTSCCEATVLTTTPPCSPLIVPLCFSQIYPYSSIFISIHPPFPLSTPLFFRHHLGCPHRPWDGIHTLHLLLPNHQSKHGPDEPHKRFFTFIQSLHLDSRGSAGRVAVFQS